MIYDDLVVYFTHSHHQSKISKFLFDDQKYSKIQRIEFRTIICTDMMAPSIGISQQLLPFVLTSKSTKNQYVCQNCVFNALQRWKMLTERHLIKILLLMFDWCDFAVISAQRFQEHS